MAKVVRANVDKSCLKDARIIWVMGGPGSGKGTQCENIQLKFGFTHLSSGDLLRAEVMSGSQRGSQLYKLMSTGEVVPDCIVDDLLAEAMVSKAEKSKPPVCLPHLVAQDNPAFKGFLIDGFPLDLDQANAFESDIGAPKAIIFLEANNEILKERLTSRGNFDDTDNSIAKRIETFNAKTLPVLEKYADKVKRINAERPKEEIFADVAKVVESL